MVIDHAIGTPDAEWVQVVDVLLARLPAPRASHCVGGFELYWRARPDVGPAVDFIVRVWVEEDVVQWYEPGSAVGVLEALGEATERRFDLRPPRGSRGQGKARRGGDRRHAEVLKIEWSVDVAVLRDRFLGALDGNVSRSTWFTYKYYVDSFVKWCVEEARITGRTLQSGQVEQWAEQWAGKAGQVTAKVAPRRFVESACAARAAAA